MGSDPGLHCKVVAQHHRRSSSSAERPFGHVVAIVCGAGILKGPARSKRNCRAGQKYCWEWPAGFRHSLQQISYERTVTTLQDRALVPCD